MMLPIPPSSSNRLLSHPIVPSQQRGEPAAADVTGSGSQAVGGSGRARRIRSAGGQPACCAPAAGGGRGGRLQPHLQPRRGGRHLGGCAWGMCMQLCGRLIVVGNLQCAGRVAVSARLLLGAPAGRSSEPLASCCVGMGRSPAHLPGLVLVVMQRRVRRTLPSLMCEATAPSPTGWCWPRRAGAHAGLSATGFSCPGAPAALLPGASM